MPLDEQEKQELEKKIREQRRSVWKGEVADRNKVKKRRELRSSKRVIYDRQKNEAVKESSEAQNEVISDEKQELEEEIEEQRAAVREEKAADSSESSKREETIESEESKEIPVVYQQEKDEEPIEKHEEVGDDTEEDKETEKAELEKKIVDQRKAIWIGEPSTESRTEKRDKRKKLRKVSADSAESGEKQYTASTMPPLKLAFLVILGFIAAILLGIAIGYFSAVWNLLRI